jgi:DNA-binding MarR family transcriptional regulator
MTASQSSLFEAVARRSDPETSKQAAAKVDTHKLESDVLYALHEYGPMTAHQIAEKCRMPLVSISPRLKPLEAKGKVRKTSERRKTPSGATAIVWKVV